MAELKDLIGKKLKSVARIDYGFGGYNEIIFTTINNKKYHLYHRNNCCENVYIEDICGALNDLVGSPITMAEEIDNKVSASATKKANGGYMPESYTWTFYKFATIKGYVTMRWLGTSNGYYSESVYFDEVK